jgi:hypothetical protein
MVLSSVGPPSRRDGRCGAILCLYLIGVKPYPLINFPSITRTPTTEPRRMAGADKLALKEPTFQFFGCLAMRR